MKNLITVTEIQGVLLAQISECFQINEENEIVRAIVSKQHGKAITARVESLLPDGWTYGTERDCKYVTAPTSRRYVLANDKGAVFNIEAHARLNPWQSDAVNKATRISVLVNDKARFAEYCRLVMMVESAHNDLVIASKSLLFSGYGITPDWSAVYWAMMGKIGIDGSIISDFAKLQQKDLQN